MKFEFIGNAGGIFHGTEGTKILCDPWIVPGVFEGSWFHYPPLKTKIKDLQNVDAIYVSHIHPDHYDDRNFDLAMERVNNELSNKSNREAHFVSSLSLAWPDGCLETVEGRVFGQLVWPPRGDRGFGYDSMFQAEGYKITFGEMDPVEKHKISHRSEAFDKIKKTCF